ncbi:MAG: Rpn family recombination-promoting nuclease/putative transposase [Lachnospiraceae bacterium]|nr:Rpn family recombination-promoting nuclease/putative transposase [Lachnospiraceae bacterium]
MDDITKEIVEHTGISIEKISKDRLEEIRVELQNISQEWEHLGITNDFIFCKIMQDKALLSELIRIILPDIEFQDINVTAQKSIDSGKDIHGVRFDIFVTSGDGTVIEIEMQVLRQGNLPRRLRFYGSMADSEMLEKGVVYSRLKDCIIIAICPFDYYKKGLHKYTFTNRCHEASDLEMGDGTTKIVLNAIGTADDVDGSLKEFLNYVAGKPSDDEYVKKLEVAVHKARQNKEWRREYMTLVMRDLENQEIGMARGREEGREEERRKQIEKLLRKGKAPEDIADYNDYPVELVKEVQKSMVIVDGL